MDMNDIFSVLQENHPEEFSEYLQDSEVANDIRKDFCIQIREKIGTGKEAIFRQDRAKISYVKYQTILDFAQGE